jgi:hypothetical protein
MTGRATARQAEGLASERSRSFSSEAPGQARFEIAHLRPEPTGLPFVVFISQRGGARHDVRLKIARGPRVRASEMVSVALRPSVRVVRGKLDPTDLPLLRRWIELNREVLINYWDGDIEYTEDAVASLQPVDPASE